MRQHITMSLLVGALLVVGLTAVPVPAGAATTGRSQAAASGKSASNAAATHATRGIVKSVDDSQLVLTRPGKKHGEMTFTVNASTQRDGTVAAGTPVSVRYREEGKTYVATAIRVQQPKQSAHKAPPTL